MQYCVEMFGQELESLQERMVCPSLQHFKFSELHQPFFADLNTEDTDVMDDDGIQQIDLTSTAPVLETPMDFAGFDDDVDEMGPMDMDDGGGDWAPTQNGPIGDDAKQETRRVSMRPGQELLISLTEGQHDIYSYFDSTLVKNWAGPAHWKVQRSFKSLLFPFQ
jgi:condensin complex subunit 2